MANFEQLKATVANVIKTNGEENITGAIMQDVLLTIINSIAGGYMFGGVAQHSGNVGNPDYNVFYLAGSGAYTGYGGAITIPDGCYGVFLYDGTWSQEVVDIGVHLTGDVATGEQDGVTGGRIKQALDDLEDNINTAINELASAIRQTFESLLVSDVTAVADKLVKITEGIRITAGGQIVNISTFDILAATAEKAGLMSAADKQKLDAFITNIRSLRIQDTTAQENQDTEITNTLKWTIGGVTEAITAFTLYAATTSKAGLMSAADKTALDTLPSLINAGYLYAGIATPSTVPSSTSAKIFYIAIEGGTYTSFGSLSITQGINIIYKSGNAWSAAQVVGIDEEPTPGSDNFVKSGGIYPLDGFLFTEQGYLSNYGCFVESQYHKTTKLICCKGAETYKIKCNAISSQPSVVFYDKHKVMLTKICGSTAAVAFETFAGNVPEGAFYLRVCNINGHQELAPKGTVLINRISNTNEGFVTSVEKGRFVSGTYLNQDGIPISNSSYSITDYIPVMPGCSYKGTLYGNPVVANIVFYDNNKEIVSCIGASDTGTTVLSGTTPDLARYVRLCTFNSDMNNMSFGVYCDYMSDIIGIVPGTIEFVNWGNLTPSTQYTNASRIFWIEDEYNSIVRYVKSIRFVPVPNRSTNIYKISVSEGSATTILLKSVGNTGISAGNVVETDLDVRLEAGEYIGLNNSLCYINTGIDGFRYLYCPTGGGTVGNAPYGSSIAIQYYGEIEISEPEAGSIRNEVIVDVHGDGDYLNPYDAMVDLKGKDTSENPITVRIMPGTYIMPTLPPADFFTYCTNRYLSLIGVDKVNCILRNDNGYYNASSSDPDNLGDNSPLKISGNIYIANLTIISTDNDNAEETGYMYHRSYCIHMDATASAGSIMEVHNCRLINNHAPCIGFGIPKDVTLKITDCELEADFWDTNFSAVIYGHDRDGSVSEVEEHVVVANCIIKSQNGDAFKSYNNHSALMDCVFVNNACALPSGKGVVLDTYTSVIPPSFGNSVEAMNVITN